MFQSRLSIDDGETILDGLPRSGTRELTHEQVRLDFAAVRSQPVRGGLAAWQQKRLAEYIEEHLGENISLGVLAGIVRLSPYHFAHAFKRSFGQPPHHYLTGRRMLRAKTLLATAAISVTDIGRAVGFVETSSFSAAFRRLTGMQPTAYRRQLGHPFVTDA